MSLMIAMPCYGSVLHVGAFHGLFSTFQVFNNAGIEADLLVTQGESAITRGRSNIVSTFRKSEYQTLAMIDSDCYVSGEDMLRLYRLAAPVRGAAVSLKTLDHTEALSCYVDGKRVPRETMPLEPFDVDYLGGAVMFVERYVIDALYKRHPELQYIDPNLGPGCHMFQEIVRDGALLTEDYSFCERVRAAGYEIKVDPTIRVTHNEGRCGWRF